jgi:hypothetical protein
MAHANRASRRTRDQRGRVRPRPPAETAGLLRDDLDVERVLAGLDVTGQKSTLVSKKTEATTPDNRAQPSIIY